MPASSLIPPFLVELEAESAATRRLLEVLPEARLAWRPHPKSYTLGQLAWHVATLPASVTQMLTPASVAAETVDFSTPQPKTVREILDAFASSLSAARHTLDTWTDAELHATWRLTAGGTERMAQPRIGLLRAIGFNHLYHHRGQLTVYLRMLDVPLPSVYGPSADENPLR